MKTILGVCLSIVLFALSLLNTSDTTALDSGSDKDSLSFKYDVFPIIEEHCLPCHLEEERNMSRLFMDNYEMLMEGGFNGPPIEPGDPEESLLIQKVGPNPPFGERMPMRSDRYLNDEELTTIKNWIEAGAEDN